MTYHINFMLLQGIPYDTRMAMMEFQLRNFQTLTEGTKVTLTYELNRYTLKVLECKPSKGTCTLSLYQSACRIIFYIISIYVFF